jgi:hypothetical protein
MSYWLGCTEDNTEVKKAVDEAQEYYNVQDRRDWVEWVGKISMPCLHVQVAMEKDMVRVEQEEAEEMCPQVERVQHEQEQAAKEVELMRRKWSTSDR